MLNEHKAAILEDAKKQFEGDLGEEIKKIIRRFQAEGIPSEKKSQKQVRFQQQEVVREEMKMEDNVEGVLEKEEAKEEEKQEEEPKKEEEEKKPEGEEAKQEEQL